MITENGELVGDLRLETQGLCVSIEAPTILTPHGARPGAALALLWVVAPRQGRL